MLTIAGGVILGVVGLILLACAAPWIAMGLRILIYLLIAMIKLPFALPRSLMGAYRNSSPSVKAFAKVVAIFAVLTLSLVGTLVAAR